MQLIGKQLRHKLHPLFYFYKLVVLGLNPVHARHTTKSNSPSPQVCCDCYSTLLTERNGDSVEKQTIILNKETAIMLDGLVWYRKLLEGGGLLSIG